jgi:hypothetical protein
MNLGAPEGSVVPAVNLVTEIYFMIMYLIFKHLSVYVSKNLVVYSTQKSRNIGDKKCTNYEIHVVLVKEIYISDNKYCTSFQMLLIYLTFKYFDYDCAR